MASLHPLAALAFSAATAAAQAKPTTELGTIAWRRDYDAGIAAAKQANEPVLLLFQEVPG